ncbi:MAG: FAD-dependent monooxygenase [Actinobacteria bacterium]|nr:FAD-dependent monooxygenase [Actinomycetota bacterium]
MTRPVADGSAVVVGAGIGGLCAALALQRAGLHVTVVERAASLQPVGAGLTIQPNAVWALRTLGIGDAVTAAGQVLATAEIRNRRGNLLAGLSRSEGERLRSQVGAPAVGIARATLQRLLVDAVGLATIRLATPIRMAAADGSSVTSVSGEKFEADLVIAADGIDSVLRAQLLGASDPRYAGYFCWRGVGPRGSFAVDWAGEYWGRGIRFGGCGIDGERLYWFLVANGPAGGRDPDGAHRHATDAVSDFPDEVRRAVAATEPDAVFRTDIADRDPVTRWGHGRLTLLGDAAHPMTPNLGQGACQAIVDAAVLGDAVWRMGPRQAALREYERRRIPRANAVVSAARRLGEVAQIAQPAAAAVRDVALRATPQALLARQLRASWSWRP